MDNKIKKAYEYAKFKHKDQIRKGSKKPYITHPVRVQKIVKKYKGTSKNIDSLRVAAFLHDVKEDCDVSLDEIKAEFGELVASLVAELSSRNEIITKISKKEYLLSKMLTMTDYALVLKLADRLDNLNDMEQMDEEFKKRYIDETRFIIYGLKQKRPLTKTQQTLFKAIEKRLSRC